MVLLSVILAAALMQPGDLVVVQAQCNTSDGVTTYAGCAFVVKSAIYTETPVYIAQGWEKSSGLADGMLVRAHVKVGSEVRLVEGIQMSDGRVWSDSRAYPRADLSKDLTAPGGPTNPPAREMPEQPASIDDLGANTGKEPEACRE